MKKTLIAVAVAALAVPGAAQAAKPAHAGQGKQSAAKSQSAKGKQVRSQKQSTPRKQRVGFAVSGTPAQWSELSGTTLGTFSLKLRSANLHARRALGITQKGSLLKHDIVKAFTAENVTVRFAGVGDTNGDGTVDLADVGENDRVKVTGKVERTRTKSGKGKPSFTYGDPAIQRIVIIRPTAEADGS
jgi:hypothetical protein